MPKWLRLVSFLVGMALLCVIWGSDEISAENVTGSGIILKAAAMRAESGEIALVSIIMELVGDDCQEVQVFSEIKVGNSIRVAGAGPEVPAIQLCPQNRIGLYQQKLQGIPPKGSCITTIARSTFRQKATLASVKNCL